MSALKSVFSFEIFPKRESFHELINCVPVHGAKFEGKLFFDPEFTGPLLQTLPRNCNPYKEYIDFPSANSGYKLLEYL